MKNLFFIIALFSVVACSAQSRVVDKSGRKPHWVNGLEKDFIIVVGTGASVQDAQRNALNMVRENIVNAVAQNVRATSEMQTEETNYSNNVSVFMERFATNVSSTSGPVPYLQGITLANVDEFYWEKLQDRNSSTVIYNYHIKYPFPNFELQKLVMDFRIRDRELTEQLQELLNNVDQIDRIEDIESSIAELRILSDYFVDGRKDQAKLGMTRYRNLYDKIELVELESDLGELKYALRFGDDYVSSSQRPQITSECARVSGTSTKDKIVHISYDYYNCYEDPENNILVRYRFGNKNVQKAFFFDVAANKASVFVSEPIRLWAKSGNDSAVTGATVDITVVSKYDAPFTIDKVTLEWPGHPAVIIDNVSMSFQGKGDHHLKLNVRQPIDAEKISSTGKTISMLSGFINFTSDRTGESRSYRILNHKYTTDW